MENIYLINNSKFNGIYLSFNYTLDISKNDISKFAVLASILSKSSGKYKNQKEIDEYLFTLFGSTFDVSVQKLGDLYNIEFSMEFVNKQYLPKKENILIDCLKFLNEIIYNPIFKNNSLDDDFFELEKESTLYKVKSKKDDKMQYAVSQTESLMAKDTLFGGYVYGDENIIKDLRKEDIYEAYDFLINQSCITILVSGNLDGYENIKENIGNILNENIKSKVSYKNLNANKENKEENLKEEYEYQDNNQSIITYGLKIKDVSSDDFYKIMLYNAILGVSPSSKLFKNFREKSSLAYTVRSKYYRFKNYIIIYAGIDKNKYEVSKKVIEKELENMKNDITNEEFESAKECILSDLNQWDDSKIALTKIKLANILSFKNGFETLDTMYENLNNVTLDDVKNIASKVYISKIYLMGGK